MRTAYTFCRYFVAAVIFFYGFAKLTGAQFTILDSELDKPLGEVSGFWLTWYYYGYSVVYGNLIALVQIVAGVLLMFRRTTLLGASVLFGVLSNIVLIDIFYGVELGALAAAVLLVCCLAFILFQHRHELIELFWTRQNGVYADAPHYRTPAVARYAVRFALLAFALGGTYWLANFNNRLPTPLDGAWSVESASGFDDETPSAVYFELNRAFMCVLRYEDTWQKGHFEVEPEENRVEIWSEWMRKENQVFVGQYALSDDRLVLRGTWEGEPVEMVLARKPVARAV